MKTVLTYGTYDMFHIGHLRLLKRAKVLGDRLIVGVSTDLFNLEKGKTCEIPYEHRAEIVLACRYVDHVIPEETWDQKKRDIQQYKIDIFVMGDDWSGKFDFLSAHTQVLYLPRTQDISSSSIRTQIQNQTR